MAVIAIKKDCPPYEYKTKKEAEIAIHNAGDDIKNYKLKYVYEKMRKPYSKTYPDRHREASLRYYHKNKKLKKKEEK